MLYSSLSGKSNFNALNLKLERRFSQGFSVLSAYSWSHSIDTDSGGSFGSPNLNPANFALDKGSSDFDIRHRVLRNLSDGTIRRRGGAALLAVRNVTKVFGADANRYSALDGIDLEVSPGEFVCLLGPSGCGKSTLLNILAGFERPSSGTVEFEGAPVRGAGRDRVMFFQDAGSALLPWLSAEENVRFALRVRRLPRDTESAK